MDFDWRNSFPVIDDDAVRRGLDASIDLRKGSHRKQDKRFILFTKDRYPETSHGYALRSRVVWWLYTGEVLRGLEFNIHHKNHNRADDRFENLEKILHREHGKHHNPKSAPTTKRTCLNCGNEFTIKIFRLRDKSRGSRGMFCSISCSTKARHKTARKMIVCKMCGDHFYAPASKGRRFCSNSCSANHRWRGICTYS